VTNFTRQQHVFSGYITAGSVTLGSVCGSTDNQLFFFMCQRGGQGWSNFTFSDQNGGVWTRILEQDFDLADSATDRRSFAVWCRKVVAADLSTALTMSALAVGASGAFKAGLVEFSADGAFDWTLAAEEAIGNTADDTPASSFGLGSTGDPGTSDNFVFAFAMLKKNSSTNPTSMEFDIAGGANITSVDGDWTMAVCLEWSAAGLTGAQDLTFSWASDTNVGSGGASIFTTAGGGTPVGLAAEADTAGSVTALKTREVGLAAEADSAQAATALKSREAGLAVEVDSAFAFTVVVGTLIGQALETDTANALGRDKLKEIALPGTVDTAFAVTPAFGTPIGQAAETDTAQPVIAAKSREPGLAAETDAAQPVTAVKELAIAIAVEADTAQPALHVRALTAGIAAETDTALALTADKLREIGIAIETDTAIPVTYEGQPTGQRERHDRLWIGPGVGV